jgi:hypothetical protein
MFIVEHKITLTSRRVCVYRLQNACWLRSSAELLLESGSWPDCLPRGILPLQRQNKIDYLIVVPWLTASPCGSPALLLYRPAQPRPSPSAPSYRLQVRYTHSVAAARRCVRVCSLPLGRQALPLQVDLLARSRTNCTRCCWQHRSCLHCAATGNAAAINAAVHGPAESAAAAVVTDASPAGCRR